VRVGSDVIPVKTAVIFHHPQPSLASKRKGVYKASGACEKIHARRVNCITVSAEKALHLPKTID
jgi:hypothetical protein